MPDLSRFTSFADRVGRVAPACSTCSTVAPTMVLQENINYNNAVALVAPVAPHLSGNEDGLDLLDRYEERAAILEFDAGMSRSEAERLARQEVFGKEAEAA